MPSLPRELWIEIFSHLIFFYEGPRDIALTRTLLSTCVVCREFRKLAQPALYRTILISLLTTKVSAGPMKLARTLIARPDLGRAVREFRISEKTVLKLNESARPCLEQMITSSSIPPRLKLMLEDTAKSGARCSAVVSLLLLALMPRLKYLYHNLESTVGPLPWILGTEIVETREDLWVTHTAIANHLPGLEEVNWICWHQDKDSTRTIKTLMLHPRMKRLHLKGACCVEGDNEDTSVQGNESMLHTALFDQCVLDGPFLKHVLSRCKNLYKLCFSLPARSPNQGKHRVSIDLDMYGEALRDFGQNLVEFNLCGFNSSAYTIVGKIGSLRQLERLRYLNIERKVFVGHGEDKMPIEKVLPFSLESFFCCIQRHDVELMRQQRASELEDEMIRLIDSGRFPKLQHIEFDRYGSRREDLFSRTLEGWCTRDGFSSDIVYINDDDGILLSIVRVMNLIMDRKTG